MAVKKQKYLTATITLPNGKRKYIRGRTRDELEQKVTLARMELRAGVNIGNTITFEEFAELWYNTTKLPHLRPNSAATLRGTLDRYVLPPLGPYQIRDIRPMQIQQVMAQLSEKSKSTQAKVIQIMRAVFLSAADNGLILKSPVLSSLKPTAGKSAEKVALTQAQSDTLLHATWGTRAYTFILIALHTGMRRGEILGLMWDDIDLDEGVIHVRHNKVFVGGRDAEPTELLKSDAAHRTLPVSEMLSVHLKLERGRSRSPYVLSMQNGKTLSPASFAQLWRIVTSRTTDDPKKLGKPSDKRHPHHIFRLDFKCHPHLLRHTYITRLFEAGLDLKEIQYLAGHSTIEMTLNVYTHYCRSTRAGETHKKVKSALSSTERVM